MTDADEARRALADAIAIWLFNLCSTCGEPVCTSWCLDLNSWGWE